MAYCLLQPVTTTRSVSGVIAATVDTAYSASLLQVFTEVPRASRAPVANRMCSNKMHAGILHHTIGQIYTILLTNLLLLILMI